MKRHRNLHTNSKPFSCEICGKTFARADALGRHMRLDNGNEGCNSKLSESEKMERRASVSSNGSRNSGISTGSTSKRKRKDNGNNGKNNGGGQVL